MTEVKECEEPADSQAIAARRRWIGWLKISLKFAWRVFLLWLKYKYGWDYPFDY